VAFGGAEEAEGPQRPEQMNEKISYHSAIASNALNLQDFLLASFTGSVNSRAFLLAALKIHRDNVEI